MDFIGKGRDNNLHKPIVDNQVSKSTTQKVAVKGQNNVFYNNVDTLLHHQNKHLG